MPRVDPPMVRPPSLMGSPFLQDIKCPHKRARSVKFDTLNVGGSRCQFLGELRCMWYLKRWSFSSVGSHKTGAIVSSLDKLFNFNFGRFSASGTALGPELHLRSEEGVSGPGDGALGASATARRVHLCNRPTYASQLGTVC